jgi:hypothetical protein
MLVENMARVRSYPDGFDVERMGTFPGRRVREPGHAG